jgi:hypothetical protein
MSVVLSVIALTVLLALIIGGLKVGHERRAAEKQDAIDRGHVGDAQHADSLRRRAEVRATPAKPAGTIGSSADE